MDGCKIGFLLGWPPGSCDRHWKVPKIFQLDIPNQTSHHMVFKILITVPILIVKNSGKKAHKGANSMTSDSAETNQVGSF